MGAQQALERRAWPGFLRTNALVGHFQKVPEKAARPRRANALDGSTSWHAPWTPGPHAWLPRENMLLDVVVFATSLCSTFGGYMLCVPPQAFTSTCKLGIMVGLAISCRRTFRFASMCHMLGLIGVETPGMVHLVFPTPGRSSWRVRSDFLISLPGLRRPIARFCARTSARVVLPGHWSGSAVLSLHAVVLGHANARQNAFASASALPQQSCPSPHV